MKKIFKNEVDFKKKIKDNSHVINDFRFLFQIAVAMKRLVFSVYSVALLEIFSKFLQSVQHVVVYI